MLRQTPAHRLHQPVVANVSIMTWAAGWSRVVTETRVGLQHRMHWRHRKLRSAGPTACQLYCPRLRWWFRPHEFSAISECALVWHANGTNLGAPAPPAFFIGRAALLCELARVFIGVRTLANFLRSEVAMCKSLFDIVKITEK